MGGARTYVSVRPNARSSISFSSSVASGRPSKTSSSSTITWHVEHASDPSHAPSSSTSFACAISSIDSPTGASSITYSSPSLSTNTTRIVSPPLESRFPLLLLLLLLQHSARAAAALGAFAPRDAARPPPSPFTPAKPCHCTRGAGAGAEHALIHCFSTHRLPPTAAIGVAALVHDCKSIIVVPRRTRYAAADIVRCNDVAPGASESRRRI